MYGNDRYAEKIMATFVVDQWISAHNVSDTIVVYTEVEDSACGLTLSVGERWLLFTNEYNGEQTTSICTPSLLSSRSGKRFREAIKMLKEIKSRTEFVRDSIEWMYGDYTISGNLKHGLPVGQWLRIRGNDTIAVFNFNELGQRHGYQMEYDDGQEEKDEWYDEVTPTIVKAYEKDRKSLRTYYELKDGRRHGKFETYYAEFKHLSAIFVNGHLEGECITWHSEFVGSEPERKVKTVRKFNRDRLIHAIRYDDSNGQVID
jgi:hypothetical protein